MHQSVCQAAGNLEAAFFIVPDAGGLKTEENYEKECTGSLYDGDPGSLCAGRMPGPESCVSRILFLRAAAALCRLSRLLSVLRKLHCFFGDLSQKIIFFTFQLIKALFTSLQLFKLIFSIVQ